MKAKIYEKPLSVSFMIRTEEICATSDLLGLPGIPFDDENTHDYNESF